MAGAPHLVSQGFSGRGQWLGVGHFEDGSHPACNRRPASGFEIFLVFEPRLAKMHLAVNDARQDVQPLGVQRLNSFTPVQIADRGDAALGKAEIAHAGAIMIDNRRSRNDQVKGLGHVSGVSGDLHCP